MGRPLPRLPWSELEARIGVYNNKELAAFTGRQRDTFGRWKRLGIPVRDADDVAAMFGFHPVEVWSGWDEVELPVEPGVQSCQFCGEGYRPKYRGVQKFCSKSCRQKADRRRRRPIPSTYKCDECGVSFRPVRNGHRFCSPACSRRSYSRDWFRRHYAEDPAFRRAKRARNDRYKAEVRRLREARRARESAA